MGKKEEKAVQNMHAKLTLECILTDQERLKYSKEMSEAVGEKQRAEDSMKSMAASFKSTISATDATIKMLADKLNTGREYRPVDCEIIKDFEAKTKTYVRTDTGSIAKLAELDADDFQMCMDV